MEKDKRTLNKYLKELRKSCGYSQEFVASHLNITRQTYSHYETGRISPPVNSLYNLARLYGVPAEEFLELAVTYNISMDFATQPPVSDSAVSEDLSGFLDYINAPENIRKFKPLDRKERMILYYYQQLDARDQQDILSFMKVKCQNRSRDRKR